MSKSPPGSNLQETAGFFGGLVRQGRLAWRLMKDSRVPGWIKLIPLAGLIYLLSPIDLLPDFAFPVLGELDDLAVILLSLKMLIDLSPPDVVREYLEQLSGKQKTKAPREETPSGPTIDAPYRILDRDKQ